ncbi:MAG: hypothetical protein LBT26_09935 [Clostridiales Family XIII bacterium]|jgi:hypothetical protein|nr:hypothetical protein [Clostridiales Family XIII bacterium]
MDSVVDILKITSAIPAANRVDNLPKQLPGDVVFDINNPEGTAKHKVLERKQGEDPREALLRNLNREIFAPLKADLTAQTEGLKKLVLFLRFFADPALTAKLGNLDELFLQPREMLDALMSRDKEATVFQGELFEALRVLAKADALPKLQDAIVNLLRAFDSQVNRDNSLRAVLQQAGQFASLLKEGDAKQVTDLLARMETLMKQPESAAGARQALNTLIKSELLPLLSSMAAKYQFVNGEKLQNQLMSVIHQVVRFDKSDIRRLEEAMARLGDELKSFGKLTDEDVADMRRSLFAHLRAAKGQTAGRGEVPADGRLRAGASGSGAEKAAEKAGSGAERVFDKAADRLANREGRPERAPGREGEAADKAAENTGGKTAKNIADVLARALEMGESTRAGTAAQSMLAQMIENESPVFALLHFLFPLKYRDEEIYSEIYVDKDCEEKKGEAGEARNIFFIIQSEKFGNFEVDLLARDRMIDLDIRCPDLLTAAVKGMREDMRGMMEMLGYRLAAYHVDIYKEERSILQRFPKLAMRKAGIDVRI